MSYHKLLNVIEPIESGLFDSLIESLKSLPTNSNNNTENGSRAMGNTVMRSSLTQTVTELYTALEALTRWTDKLTNASKFLAKGRDVESITVNASIRKDLMKGEDIEEAKKTQKKQLEEVRGEEKRTTAAAAAVVEEMHKCFLFLYLDILEARSRKLLMPK
ncbi:hypothetical protein GE21DRAFT_6524 [Neurospora crassa]|uniref:Uncharacterized protein n=1 Tax=Neurospora crassa (strain ATCC 24698 / 74-OR23-1A / CBS 708.71 / DSM 1257 / FGSC 987) TaxID=367110 RepID=Q7S9A5_NEUCR|nr:hypothetical protein NCU07031 [Neurospora crassa OR74A]EAA32934.3 hypothetical protein NCU07031 [Neurospora crassa OR74A]KHE80948.1 hypothetical protein GE21DRAFT_6524 [Neurospora crassa]|eukprot:XP_962170.3 hypothetical protein NCU07031 [Neurospora crassa OR74A]